MGTRTADQAAPARKWVAVTPSDSVNLPLGCCGIFIGGAGNIVLVGSDDAAATFTGVSAGQFLPCGPKRVNSTSTTATLILALY
jgi:hypothetical protein